MKKSLLLIIALALGVGACTEDTNSVITPGQKPVIEAYLGPGQPIEVKVTKEIAYATDNTEAKAEPINGLNIKVAVSNGKTITLKNSGDGKYTSASTELVAGTGTTYKMEFSYSGLNVTAEATIPKRPEGFRLDKTSISRTKIDLSGGGFPNFGSDDNTAINAYWKNPEGVYHFLAAENITKNPVKVVTPPSGISLPRTQFTRSPNTGTTEALPPPSFEYFGTYRVILYRVGQEYADMYKSGGTSTQNLSTPASNVKNGLGIFTGVNADTLKLVVNQK